METIRESSELPSITKTVADCNPKLIYEAIDRTLTLYWMVTEGEMDMAVARVGILKAWRAALTTCDDDPVSWASMPKIKCLQMAEDLAHGKAHYPGGDTCALVPM